MTTTMQIQAAVAQQANLHLIGVFFLLLLSGLYIGVFVETVSVLISRRSARESQPRWLVAAAVFLFVDLLLDVITVMIRAYLGLRVDPDGLESSAVSYFMDQATPLAIIPDVCLIIGMLLTDGIMVYRTYVVWGSRLIVIAVPVTIWVANASTTIWVLVGLVSSTPSESVLEYLTDVLTRVTITAALTLLLNLICASLIAWKILRMTNESSNRSQLSRAVEIIVQSAGVWCASLFVFIVTAAIRTPAFFVVLDCMMPIMTTVFSLIIVRLGRRPHSPHMHATELSDVRFNTSEPIPRHFSTSLSTEDSDVEVPARVCVQVPELGDRRRRCMSALSSDTPGWELDVEYGKVVAKEYRLE